MSSVGGQPGNKNASKSRVFEQAFLRALKQRDIEHGDGETIRRIADKMIDLALAGDVAAFKEARDTVDGKPAQQLQLAGHDGEKLTVVFESADSAA